MGAVELKKGIKKIIQEEEETTSSIKSQKN